MSKTVGTLVEKFKYVWYDRRFRVEVFDYENNSGIHQASGRR